MPGLADVRPSIGPVLYRSWGRIRLQQLRTLLTHTLAPYLRAAVQRRLPPHPGPGSGSSDRAVRELKKTALAAMAFLVGMDHSTHARKQQSGPPDMLDKSVFFHQVIPTDRISWWF